MGGDGTQRDRALGATLRHERSPAAVPGQSLDLRTWVSAFAWIPFFTQVPAFRPGRTSFHPDLFTTRFG